LGCAALLIADDQLRRGSARFNLGAHLLKARSESLNLLLLLGYVGTRYS